MFDRFGNELFPSRTEVEISISSFFSLYFGFLFIVALPLVHVLTSKNRSTRKSLQCNSARVHKPSVALPLTTTYVLCVGQTYIYIYIDGL